MAGPRAVGAKLAALERGQAVEEHLLDADVVVEVLEMAPVRGSREGVSGDRGRTVRGDVEAPVGRGACGSERAGDPARARHVDLKAVDGARLQEPEEVAKDVAVLAGRDLEPVRRALADD
ncbi:MAG TPA: hypothetical protein VH306_04270 [Gaiellaceae bacterium]